MEITKSKQWVNHQTLLSNNTTKWTEIERGRERKREREREREREQKPQQGEDLMHDSGGQKQIHQFGQARYQPKQPFSVRIRNCV